MSKLVVLVLAFVACAAYVSASPAVCAGCPHEVDANDSEYLNELKKVLAQQNSGIEVKSIEKIRTQVVAGEKIMIDFISKDDKSCHASWVIQVWKSSQPQYVEIKCT